MLKSRKGPFDIPVFVLSLGLLGLGVVLVYSSSFALAQERYGGADFFLARQAVRALLAVLLFVVFVNIDYHVWTRSANLAFAAALVLLVVVLVAPQGLMVKGARRWISLGFISFQASDFARVALVIFLARHLSRLGEGIRQWQGLWPQLCAVLAVCALVIVEPNYSTALVICIVGLTVIFVSGARFVHFGAIAAAGIPIALLGMVGAEYRVKRLMAFLKPGQFQETIGYQAYQAIIGLGNGGILGRGLGQGQQKYFYLPEPHTDFVFAILGEEIGFVGLVVVLAAFGFIIYRGLRIALRAPDKDGQLMAFGFSFMLAVYVVLHAAVNTGLIPTTGVPLPFLSYGGMSLVFTMCAMGILLNISSQSRVFESSPVHRDERKQWRGRRTRGNA